MKNFKKLLFLLPLAAVFMLSLTVHAQAKKYTAGILSDYKFSGNDISDYARGSVNAAMNYAKDAEVNFTELSLNDCINALNADKIDFISMIPQSAALSQSVDYSSDPIATGFLTLLADTEDTIFFEDFDSYDNIKIGMIKNSFFEDILKEYSQKNNFTYIPVYFDTVKELTAAVDTSAADAILVPSTEKPNGMRLIAKCGEFNYYCAVKKGNTAMLDLLNNAVSLLKTDSPFYLSETFSDYFRNPYFKMAALTRDEYNALSEHEKLRILVPENNYPMVYFDKEKDKYDGVYVDIINKVAENSGINIEFISTSGHNMTANAIVTGKADAVLTASGPKEGLITTTEPYTSIAYLPVAKKTASVFEESKMNVGILADDDWIEDSLASDHPRWSVQKYNSINSLLRAVEHDKITVALLSSTDMQTKTSLIAHPDLSLTNDFSIRIPVSLGLSELSCKSDMVNLLNKIIKSVSVSESEFESRVYTLNHIYVPNFRDMIYANKVWLIVIFLIFALIVFISKMRELYFRKLSQIDSLTQIHNKEYFYSAAEKILAKNPDKKHLLVSVDPRNFKVINDRFGHIIGDQTLVNIASQIRDIFRGKCLYARAQGDRFLVLAENTQENRKLIESLASIDIYIHNSTKYHVFLKIGVCPIAKYDPDINLSSYIDRANIAKEGAAGKNSNYLCYFSDEMEKEFSAKNTIEIEMVKALKRGDFIVYYQPKYELESDRIIGAEALVRWNHAERGIISPGVFIPLFEKNGFIVNLDFHVYESVFKMIKDRLRKNLPVVTISMNVSRCHLGDATFVKRLEALVKKYEVPKKYIEMEITESIFSRDDDSAISLIYELKDHGFTVSMDDFGSGYSSLNLLRLVPIDTLKIDKVFIDNTEDSPRSQVIIEEIIAMASKIQVKTICEGVETKTQRDFLKKAGCNMVQGFFYSRPLPSSAFESLLDSSN